MKTSNEELRIFNPHDSVQVISEPPEESAVESHECCEKIFFEENSNSSEVSVENEYIGIHDGCGYGVVGYGFRCQYCEAFNMFVDEEESEQICEECGKENKLNPRQYG